MKGLLLFVVLFLASCGYDEFGGPPSMPRVGVEPNADLSMLRDIYPGSLADVTDDIVVGGWVTSNDRAGNFYRTLVIQDGTGAVEIMAGLYELHACYPPGRRVVVRAEGMTLGMSNGVVQLGLGSYGSGASPGYVHFPALLDRHVMVDDTSLAQEPLALDLDRLATDMCGRLVVAGDLRLKEGEPGTWADADGYSSYNYRIFADGDGREIAVLVSGYADFALSAVPTGRVAVTGILQYGNAAGRSRFIIKIRDTDDVALL